MLRIGPVRRYQRGLAEGAARLRPLGSFSPPGSRRDPATASYSPAQLPEIRRIVGLRDLGVGLTEIRRLVRAAPICVGPRTRRSALEAERREVDRRLAALDIQVASADAETGIGDVVLRPIAGELVATMRIDPRLEMVEQTFNVIEAHVRDLGRRARRPPGIVEIDDEATTSISR